MVGTVVLQVTTDFIEIDAKQARGPVTRTVLETLITDDGTDVERQKIAAVLGELLQLDIETRIHIDDLPADEETIGFNNNQMEAQFGERMRWDREGPDLFLVSTEDIITVTWSAINSQYVVNLRVTV